MLRYRPQLEAKRLAASTINIQLVAAPRLASMRPIVGLLAPELFAGIQCVKGVPQIGGRVATGSVRQRGEKLLSATPAGTLQPKRDTAIAALLLGCGLGRSEQNPRRTEKRKEPSSQHESMLLSLGRERGL